ncbi:hypothetical protein [Bradyrhizobium ivorense]|uniref:hypothetical protein n=1 Tax=Bradyrhizobium ivorense TaxID=2511166 RepID=UPI001117217E|nr:hypothetical protein [Bradyrhizobium ivorense]
MRPRHAAPWRPGARGPILELLEGILILIGQLLGWPIRWFGRWLDRQPHRDPSQISTLHKAGRLALGCAITLMILLPLGWLIF